MSEGISEASLRAKLDEEVGHLQERLKDRDRELESYRREHGKLAHFFRQLHAAVEPIKPVPSEYRPRSEVRVAHPCAAVMHTTDGHHGAVQDPDEIEGFNAFSPAIGEARQLGFAQDVVEWVDLHRHDYQIAELHHLVTGDLISGAIHNDLLVTNAWPAPVQAIRAGELLAKQISITAPHFEKVCVQFIVADNHARLTTKPPAKEAGLNSLNYVVGHHAQALLSEHKNVEFNLYPMHETVIHVLNRQYLICHGHDVRGWMGMPWYGIERKVGREAVARLQIIMEEAKKIERIGFHRYVFGHYHVPVDMPLYICGGSVSGTDALDHKQGRYAKPSQSAWMVHPKWGEFDRTNFNLRDDPREEE